MNKSGNKIIIGIGIACLMSGVYWIFKGGDLLEIILPIILGISFIGSSYFRFDKKSGGPN